MLDPRLIISPEARSEMRWMDVMIDDCSIRQCDQKANRVVDLTPNLWQLSKCFNAHSGTSGCESAIIALYFSGVLPLYKQREARQQHCHRRFAHHRLFYFVYFSRFACVFRVLLMWRYDESGFTKLQINYIIVVLVERLGPAKSNHSISIVLLEWLGPTKSIHFLLGFGFDKFNHQHACLLLDDQRWPTCAYSFTDA